MAEFKVVIDGLDLDDEAMQGINDDIQRVVLARLAGTNITKGKQVFVGWRPRPDWYGLIARILDRRVIEQVEELNEIEQRFGR